MLYDHTILYREGDGPLQSLVVRAASKAEAERLAVKAGVKVESVSEKGEPVLDYSKKTFTREEAAAYLGLSYFFIGDLQRRGLLPAPKNNMRGVFHVRELEHYREQVMQIKEWNEQRRKAA